jgi:hypothetical protein
MMQQNLKPFLLMTDQENPEFLKHVINENLYLIDEQRDEYQTDESNEPDVVHEPIVEMEKPGKSILVIFGYSDMGRIPQQQEEYLVKILAAVDLKLEDIDLKNSAQTHETDQYEKVICFTKKYSGIPTPKHYEIDKIRETNWLVVDELNLISASTDLRKRLWNVLKTMFP